MKRLGVVFCMLFVVCCSTSGDLQAQATPPCTETIQVLWYGYPGGWIPINPAGNVNCFGLTWLAFCVVPTAACAPKEAPDPPSKCPNCGRPISLADGNTSIEQTDARLPGLGGGLVLTRTWNSKWPASEPTMQLGIFGPNWRSTFEERIFSDKSNYWKYSRGDGEFWWFGYNNGPWIPAAPANVSATLILGATSWTMTFPNGETRTFDITYGHLLSISDRNGNTTQIAYDSSNRLSVVTDPAGRSLTFTYGSPTSFLVTGVSSSVGGLSLTYSYDSQGRLTQVTNPDLSTINYTYNSASLITSVTDSQGKVLESHTYDNSARGLTSSRANGVESLTIIYPAN
jgi:YD repeat-containing protein